MARAYVALGLAALTAVAAGYGAGELVRARVAGPAPAPVAPSAPAAASDGQETPAPAPDTANHEYAGLGQFIVPVVKDSRVVMFLLAEVTLELAGPDDRPQLEVQRPKIRSAVLESLYDVAASGALAGEKIDVPAITARLTRDVQTALGPVRLQQLMFDRLVLQNNSKA